MQLYLEGSIASDPYAMMGLYKVTEQKSAPKNMHSSRNQSSTVLNTMKSHKSRCTEER